MMPAQLAHAVPAATLPERDPIGPALELSGLAKSYGGRRVVDGLTLTAARGEVVALLGPNGAGKTTTIEICEGFRRADAGQVRVLGLDPTRDAAALKPQVGVMLQDGVGAYTGAKARELIALFASYAVRPHDPAEMLERVGLGEVAGTPVKRLSGGQRQRLSLALALVGRPALVFLDEPTAGMDLQARRSTWELVSQLRSDGVSVVLTTHHLDEAEQLADTIVVINHGRVAATGSPTELTRAGAEGQIRFRAPAGLRLSSLQDALQAGATASEETPGHYLVTGERSPQLLAGVTAWCAAQAVFAEDIAVGRRSLEDVFLEITGAEVPA
jgi:ABC-2 type transport system ATP-binding protein